VAYRYLGGVQALLLFAPTRAPVAAACSIRRLVCETCLGVLLYDLAFYPVHMMLHKWGRIRHIHAIHHDGYEKKPIPHIVTVIRKKYVLPSTRTLFQDRHAAVGSAGM
jgi:sterol desaturase/sphingolipid hydroxylase (fatty acid hydroxylase superfamily)